MTSKGWSPDRIRALRNQLGLSRSEFGRILLGIEAKRADGWVARIEEPERSDSAKPSRPVCVLLDWLAAGGRPPHWYQVVGEDSARSAERQGEQPHG